MVLYLLVYIFLCCVTQAEFVAILLLSILSAGTTGCGPPTMARFADFILVLFFSKMQIVIYIIILIFYGFAYFYIFRFVL